MLPRTQQTRTTLVNSTLMLLIIADSLAQKVPQGPQNHIKTRCHKVSYLREHIKDRCILPVLRLLLIPKNTADSLKLMDTTTTIRPSTPIPASEDKESEDGNQTTISSPTMDSPGVSPVGSPLVITLDSDEESSLHPSLLGRSVQSDTVPELDVKEAVPEIPKPSSEQILPLPRPQLPTYLFPSHGSYCSDAVHRVNIAPPVADTPVAPSARAAQVPPRPTAFKSTAGVRKPNTRVCSSDMTYNVSK